MHLFLVPFLLCLASYFSVALSFSVTVGSPPAQCGSLSVAWTGGQAPFEIVLIPVYGIPRNVSIPSSAFSNNQGSYQISPIPFNKGTQLLLTMSDTTGFGTGGTSELITVGEPVTSASCNTSNPALPFSFGLPSSLQQCSPYIFNGYDGAVMPVTITGFIPGGDLFILHPPSTGTSFTWVANVAAGTTIVFTMTDAQGNSGGSSDTETVALSDVASCLNANSPSSTLSSLPSSTNASPTQSSSHLQSSSHGVSAGTIAGVAVGVALAIAAIVALAVFYLKRQRYGRSPYGRAQTRNSRRPNSVELDPGFDNFHPPPIYPFPYTDSVSRLDPPVMLGPSATSALHQETHSTSPSSASGPSYALQQHSRTSSNTDSFAAFGDIASSSMSSSGRRKAAIAGISNHQPATRFIVHTDAEDVPENQPEVVELPPQYSERRTPLAAHTGESRVTELSSTDLTYLSGQHVDDSPALQPPIQ